MCVFIVTICYSFKKHSFNIFVEAFASKFQQKSWRNVSSVLIEVSTAIQIWQWQLSVYQGFGITRRPAVCQTRHSSDSTIYRDQTKRCVNNVRFQNSYLEDRLFSSISSALMCVRLGSFITVSLCQYALRTYISAYIEYWR